MSSVGVIAHEQKSLGDGLGALRAGLAAAGYDEVCWRQVSASKKAPKEVRRLLDEGVDRLLVWGGDGTVRRCVDTIVGEDAHVEVAILPAGTANLLAHALDIPIDLDKALDVALNGALRLIDVGMINGEVFVVMAGTGFDALMIRDADDSKDRLGKFAYIRSGVRNIDGQGAEATITVDGQKWFSGHATCVLIGNTGRILGGIQAFPHARFDDGRIDVGVVTAQSRTDWLRLGVRAVTGRIESSPLVDITQGSCVKVRLDHPMPWELDGGDRPKVKKLDVSVLPGRLAICVPRP